MARKTTKWTLPLTARWDKEALIQRRGDIGMRAFDLGFRLKAITDEDLYFPSFKDLLLWDRDPLTLLTPTETWRFYGGVDVSSSTRPGSVIVTIAASSRGLRVPVDVDYGSWTPDQLVDRLITSFLLWDHQQINFENNSLQEAYISLAKLKMETLETGRTLPIKGFCTGKSKADPLLGLSSLEIEFEQGKWAIAVPHHGPHCQRNDGKPCAWCWWRESLISYPMGVTDPTMATWFAREAIGRGQSYASYLRALYGTDEAEGSEADVVETAESADTQYPPTIIPIG